MPASKLRLDNKLVEESFFSTLEKARAAIMAGQVYVDDLLVDKPGFPVKNSVQIQVREKKIPYVSRGGLKLEKAIKSFHLDLQGKVVLDAGASTGGFTDCALQHGARLVYAVDVSYGQLAWPLRQDPRVKVLERTNIRYLTRGRLKELPDFTTIDVSFISITKVLPQIIRLMRSPAAGVALIKPQFEANRNQVGKKGVVRDPLVHLEVIKHIATHIENLDLQVHGLDFSPVTGKEGNIEYLIYFSDKTCKETGITEITAEVYHMLVEHAHKELY